MSIELCRRCNKPLLLPNGMEHGFTFCISSLQQRLAKYEEVLKEIKDLTKCTCQSCYTELGHVDPNCCHCYCGTSEVHTLAQSALPPKEAK